jgi:hypothetical protein
MQSMARTSGKLDGHAWLDSTVKALLWLGVPTVLRFLLDPWLGDAAWFTTYYPFVLLATWTMGWEIGIVLVLIAALIGNFAFMQPRFHPSLHVQSVAGTIAFVAAAGGIVLVIAFLHPVERKARSPRAAGRGESNLPQETFSSPERALGRPYSAADFSLGASRHALVEDARRVSEGWRRLAENDSALARRIAPQVSPVFAESLASALSAMAVLEADDEALFDELSNWLLPPP